MPISLDNKSRYLKFKYYLACRGLNLTQLSKILGCTRGNIWALFSGRFGPNSEVEKKLRKMFPDFWRMSNNIDQNQSFVNRQTDETHVLP